MITPISAKGGSPPKADQPTVEKSRLHRLVSDENICEISPTICEINFKGLNILITLDNKF